MVPGGLTRAQLFTTWVEQNSGETLDLIPKVRLVGMVGYTQKVGVKTVLGIMIHNYYTKRSSELTSQKDRYLASFF